ncbi:hypothetical protein KIN20_015616 [Parelaphostrongylus tenuis]|uniref:Uncharacterized protein n=1 Tax=Parelaphostrongylus tenuis TaxID=148309 RepID=A0AAD5QQ17_PARTN|nr:hypothetical protein KIN20_015616 [Parelaphostrongylus tenuis]
MQKTHKLLKKSDGYRQLTRCVLQYASTKHSSSGQMTSMTLMDSKFNEEMELRPRTQDASKKLKQLETTATHLAQNCYN